MIQILVGDCLVRMKGLADNSVDSVVCDPPYHLVSIVKRFGSEIAAPAKVGATGAFARASKGFMGQTWDGGDVAFRPETWAEVLRVLKPGGHLVAFSGTRTYHRMAAAIEDAGFEVRDMIAWHYGSGFPKSLDVSKQLDAQEKNRWLDVAKAVDSLDESAILIEWVRHSEAATSAGVSFQKNQTEAGQPTALSDFAHAPVLLAINPENSLASAIIAELMLRAAPPISEGDMCSAQEDAAASTSESIVLVTIVRNPSASLDPMQDLEDTSARDDVQDWPVVSISPLERAAEALKIWLGSDRFSKRAATDALCAALTDALKLITLSQSATFQSYDTTSQTECVSVTSVTTTESTAASLISSTVVILKAQAVAKAADAERKVIGRRHDADKLSFNGKHEGWDRPWMRDDDALERCRSITAPATDEARKWQGYGTALKPATEPICLARKPLSEKSIAANCLRWGTGALNIDGCRIEGSEIVTTHSRGSNGAFPKRPGETTVEESGRKQDQRAGLDHSERTARWPANLCHDGSDEVLAGFPETTSGEIATGTQHGDFGKHGRYGKAGGYENPGFGGNSGSAARFFYTAKASSDERGEGNNHPTVKPIALMQWLCRLVTPKGGTVLDPFCGSGSTLIAADAEQFNAIGCELSPEYAAIAERRVRDAAGMFADVKVAA